MEAQRFNTPAADCRKRADTQSNVDSGAPADFLADFLDPTLHSLLAEPVPIRPASARSSDILSISKCASS